MSATDQEVLDELEDADVHRDFKEVVRLSIEEDIGLNMVSTLRMLVGNGSPIEDIKNIGNPTEQALAEDGVHGVEDSYGAAPDSTQQEVFERVK